MEYVYVVIRGERGEGYHNVTASLHLHTAIHTAELLVRRERRKGNNFKRDEVDRRCWRDESGVDYIKVENVQLR